MKTRTLLLLLSVFYSLAIPLHAQQDAFHPFLHDGKTWVVKNYGFNYMSEDGVSHSKAGDRIDYVYGDTVINNKVWKKCFSNYPDGENFTFYAALRQEGEQIYAVISGDTQERLLYDYGLKPGDVLYRAARDQGNFLFLLPPEALPQSEDEWAEADFFCRPGIDNLQLQSIDTVQLNGNLLRRFVFKSEWALKSPQRKINAFPYPQLVWIEGIGSEGGLFSPWKANKDQEVCCQLDGNPLIEYEDFFAPSFKPLPESIQTTVPFVEDGKVWRMLYQNPEIPDICPDYEFSYFISGDTLIAGRECKKFYGYNEKNDGLTLYKLALFEEDDRVYFIRAQSVEPYVLYDFSESFQKTTTVSDGVLMRLFERKPVNINGTERLCLHLNRQWDNQDENFWDWPTGWWIQGVGSILGPLNNWGFSNSGNLNHFISCEVNGETIFTTSDFMERFSDHVYVYECIQQTGFNMFSKLAENPEAADNLCFSPLSAQLVLSMVANGADGSTLREMQQALGTYGYPSDFLNRRYNLLTTSLTSRPPYNPDQWNGYGDEDLALQQYEAAYPICEIVNSVWCRPEVSLFESFTDVIKAGYDAGFGSAEFDTQEGIDLVNNWANDKTHGMIPTIFDEPLRPDIAVVLADALYFKGSWAVPFEKKDTKPGQFLLADGSAVNTDMMSAKSEYCLTENGKFRAVTLPYGAGDFSMTLFVPVEGTMLPGLTRDDWMMAMSSVNKPAHVSLTMPKFSIDGRYDLEPVMKSLGMVEAFGGSADFSRMSDIALFIDEAFQLSKIAVDEEGTEASAVSVVTMTKSGKQPDYEDFRVDRPFYFTIENRKEQSVLFVGRVTTLPDTSVSRFDGDVNSDGETNISDIVTIINVMAGKDANTGTDMNAPAAVKAKSDVNHDGKTDISDITAVINIMAGQK